ncbi:MAG TPA: penicillin-binding transpeptidase domain-containing protein [Gemmatimonadales bacterium]|nr:penicillin-binding transpeptidase domain-containing protein [Gemmatimonadales bacterium]
MIKAPSRITLIEIAFALAALAVVGKAVDVQLVQGGQWRQRARAQQTVRVPLPARRGTLFDRNGAPLAVSQETYGVGLAPQEVSDRGRAVPLLARALRRPEAEIARAFASERVWVEWPGPYPWNDVMPLKTLRGVYLQTRLERFYPRPDLAPQLVGRVGDGGRGASGLERALDSLLAGVPGSAVMLRDQAGHTYPSPSRPAVEPRPGDDVYLTLDAQLEEIAQHALAAAVDSSHASGGDVVIVQPATGEVLAMASVRRAPAEGGGPGDTFEPGSTAKVFTAAALLRDGKATPGDKVYVEHGTYQLGRRVIHDVHPADTLTLADVLRVSSNIGMAKLGARLTPAEQFTALRDFGFGTATGVELAGEAAGRLRNPRAWTAESPASLAMGYELAVTPLQLAAAYGVLANRGVLLEPTLVRWVRDRNGDERWAARPRPVRQVVTASVASELTRMLQGVVEEGTGRRAALGTYSVAGKTGTARRAVGGKYLPGHYWASFVGIFPALDPQLVLVVKLDDPQGEYFAGSTAAPVVRTILEAALATPGVALDRGRLVRRWLADTSDGSPAAAPAPGTTVVLPWPVPPARPDTVRPVPVPDVAGSDLRAAARTLHRRGFEVRVQGWGRVVGTVPAAGTPVAPGRTVVVRAEAARAG